MAEFLDNWVAAKEEFEATTGLKKPAAKGKALFVTFRKPTGLEDVFEEIDKYIAAFDAASTINRNLATELNENFFKKWETVVARMERKQADYFPVLKKAIDDELEESGKSDKYRAFKTFKAALETNTSRAKMKFLNYRCEWQARKEAIDEGMAHFEHIARLLANVGHSLKSAPPKRHCFARSRFRTRIRSSFCADRPSGRRLAICRKI